MRRFIVIDCFGNSRIVEGDDAFEAVENSYNNHYKYSHIVSVTEIPEEDD